MFVSNLNAACLRCLCFAITGCNGTHGCSKGYCGPFYISRVYWADAGKPVFPEDDPDRAGGKLAEATDLPAYSTLHAATPRGSPTR